MKTLLRYLFGAGKAAKTNVITIDRRPWYMAQDICDWLGIASAHSAIHRKDNEDGLTPDKTEWRIETIPIAGSGNKCVNLVNNGGMLKLIYQAQTPNALKVQQRVVSVPAELKPVEWIQYIFYE